MDDSNLRKLYEIYDVLYPLDFNRLTRRSDSLSVAVLSHILADLGIILTAFYMLG